MFSSPTTALSLGLQMDVLIVVRDLAIIVVIVVALVVVTVTPTHQINTEQTP